MRTKQIMVLVATMALAIPAAAQMMGMGPQIPTLSGIWHPVVGNGAAYEITQQDKKTPLELDVVGKEDVDGKTGYWIETSVTDPRMGGEMIIKMLQTVEGNTINHTRTVMQMPGQGPMEVDANMMNNMAGRRAPQSTAADFRDKAELVGTESITVPAGTFSCQHYHMKDGSGDAWISDKVIPWGLVKMQDDKRTMVLTKVVTDAKDRITGTPTKFDPMQMMRNRQMQQNQQ